MARRQPGLFNKDELGDVRLDKGPKKTPHFVTRCEINPLSRALEVDVTLCWRVQKAVTLTIPASMVPQTLQVETQDEDFHMDVDKVTFGKLVGPEIHSDGLYLSFLVGEEYVSVKLDQSTTAMIAGYANDHAFD